MGCYVLSHQATGAFVEIPPADTSFGKYQQVEWPALVNHRCRLAFVGKQRTVSSQQLYGFALPRAEHWQISRASLYWLAATLTSSSQHTPSNRWPLLLWPPGPLPGASAYKATSCFTASLPLASSLLTLFLCLFRSSGSLVHLGL